MPFTHWPVLGHGSRLLGWRAGEEGRDSQPSDGHCPLIVALLGRSCLPDCRATWLQSLRLPGDSCRGLAWLVRNEVVTEGRLRARWVTPVTASGSCTSWLYLALRAVAHRERVHLFTIELPAPFIDAARARGRIDAEQCADA